VLFVGAYEFPRRKAGPKAQRDDSACRSPNDESTGAADIPITIAFVYS